MKFDPSSPEELQRFRERLAERISDDQRRLKNLNRASGFVLIFGVFGVVFLFAATWTTRDKISELEQEKGQLEKDLKYLKACPLGSVEPER